MKEPTSVIGLGRMGSALALTLRKDAYPVHVWNRTTAKAGPLVEVGAVAADSVRDAIAATTTVVICVGNYADTNAVLDGCDDLAGKTVIQLTSGDINDAQTLQAWVEARGGLYLDGAILAYPSGIGAAETLLAVAGGEDAWAAGESVIRCFGGASIYMGTHLMAPIALESATTIPALLATLGMIQGAHQLESVGFDLNNLPDVVGAMAPLLNDSLEGQARVIATNRFTDTEADLKTWAAGIGANYEGYRALGFDVSLVEAANGLLNRAVAAGYGDEELAALIKVLRADTAKSSAH